jgi:hypothetical protein
MPRASSQSLTSLAPLGRPREGAERKNGRSMLGMLVGMLTKASVPPSSHEYCHKLSLEPSLYGRPIIIEMVAIGIL